MASPWTGVRGLLLLFLFLFELLIGIEFDDGFASFLNRAACHRWKTFAVRIDAPSYVLGSGGECHMFNNLINNLDELMR